MNKLAVVVLSWNGADLIAPCLKSLASQTYDNFQIVVVDNNSQDNSGEILEQHKQKLGDKLHIIYNDKNSGFAGGVNIGIKYASNSGFDGVALFNSDATADKEWLSELAKVLKSEKDVGIATGLLLHQDGKTIDSSGDWYSKWGLSFPRGRDQLAETAPKSGYVFTGSGGASLYRIKMFDDIGIFDETFFAYYEDVDVGFRAQLAGWKVYYTNKAIAYHEQGGSSKKIPGFTIYKTFKNLPLLFIKNVPTRYIFRVGIRFCLAYWLMFFNTLRHGTILYAIKGWLMSVVHTPGALIKRFGIQSKRKASSDYIWSMIWQDMPPEQSGLRKFRKIFGGDK